MRPTIAELHERFAVDPNGRLLYRVDCRGGKRAGQEAGSTDHKGYRQVGIKGMDYKVHHVIWAMTTGEWPINQIDHFNEVKDDNTFSNLREANNSQNHCNIKHWGHNTSGVKNVHWNKLRNKWHVQVQVNRKNIYCGLYDDLELAELVASEARRVFHKEFAHDAR